MHTWCFLALRKGQLFRCLKGAICSLLVLFFFLCGHGCNLLLTHARTLVTCVASIALPRVLSGQQSVGDLQQAAAVEVQGTAAAVADAGCCYDMVLALLAVHLPPTHLPA